MDDICSHSQHQRKESITKSPSDYELAFELDESQAASTMFPPGCKVCFDHCTSHANKHVYEATEGIVASVWMGKDRLKPTSTSFHPICNVEVIDAQGIKTISPHFHDDLAFACGTPVYLDKKAKAEIAFSQRTAIDTSKGHMSLVYIVVTRDGSIVRAEKGVKPARVTYRKVAEVSQHTNDKSAGANEHSAALNETHKPSKQPDDGVKHGTDSHVPHEIIPNQVDSLSEALTEVPDISQAIRKEHEVVTIKEEPIADELLTCQTTSQDGIVDVNEMEQNDTNLQQEQGALIGNKQFSLESKGASLTDTENADLPPKQFAKELVTATSIDSRWAPPKRSSSIVDAQMPSSKHCTDSNSLNVTRSCKMNLPHWLYRTDEEQNGLFREFMLHLLPSTFFIYTH